MQAPQAPAESGVEPASGAGLERPGPGPEGERYEGYEDDEEYWAPPPHTPRRSAYILGLITLTGLMVLLMLGLLYYRWLGVVEPTTAIVFEGDETVAGTEIVVDGGAKRIEVTLDENNNYVTPVLLVPGDYTVTARHDGRVMLRQNFTLRSLEGRLILLGEKAVQKRRRTAGAEPAAGAGGAESTADASSP